MRFLALELHTRTQKARLSTGNGKAGQGRAEAADQIMP